MSDFNDILYDPRIHTHTSCVDEVAGCDAVVLLVGPRYGGRIVPEALLKLDFDALAGESKSLEVLKSRENASVTQLEILKAVEQGIPVFTFIEERVWHDHALYEKNKSKEILPHITFPSIERPETAQFIFEFINFLRHRARGNSVHPFSKIQDIEEVLRTQWSGLFQRLLNEQRARRTETRRIDALTEQFEDLKTAILTSISSSNEREVARGVVRFRRLADFLRGLGLHHHNFVLRDSGSWEELMNIAGITQILDAAEIPSTSRSRAAYSGFRPRAFMLKTDGTFYEVRFPPDFVQQLREDWEAFVLIQPDSREVILEALGETQTSLGIIKHRRQQFDNHLEEMIFGEAGEHDKPPLPTIARS